MKNLKLIALSALAFVTIASMVFVGCQKQQELVTSQPNPETKSIQKRVNSSLLNQLSANVHYKNMNELFMRHMNIVHTKISSFDKIQSEQLLNKLSILQNQNEFTNSDLVELSSSLGYTNYNDFSNYLMEFNSEINLLSQDMPQLFIESNSNLTDIINASFLNEINNNEGPQWHMVKDNAKYAVCLAGVYGTAVAAAAGCMGLIAPPLILTCEAGVTIAAIAGYAACYQNCYPTGGGSGNQGGSLGGTIYTCNNVQIH